MPGEERKEFKVEGARILFRNFSGRKDTFNPAGDRTFACVLTQEAAEAMAADGWNVKLLAPREEGDEATPYIQVKIGYEFRPPKIIVISSTARTHLDESTVGELDHAEFTNVDLICRGRWWTMGDKSGWKAYLQSMYVTIYEDDLDRKYALSKAD